MSAPDPTFDELPERFTLGERIGHGGMATVYRAQDSAAREDVALKILHPHLRRDPLILERFRREITAARRIQHPAVIRIYDLIETENLAVLVLELHPGRDLKRVLRHRGALPIGEAIELVEQVLSGLSVAHQAGIIHRDIKPHNVLVNDEGVAKLTDFGLARVDDLISVTTHTMTLGTPEYMAPELLGSSIVDARVDLYGTGVMLYEMLTGKLPFRASTPLALMEMHQRADIPHACEARPEIPKWLGDIVLRAMAKTPEDRFQTAEEMLEAIRYRQSPHNDSHALVEHRKCTACEAPLLPGVDVCVECGTERVQVRETTKGGYVVLGGRRRFSREDKDYLTFAQKNGLLETLERLGSHVPENTAKLDKRLRKPPLIVAQHLSCEDAALVVSDLRQQGLRVEHHEQGIVNRLRVTWKLAEVGRSLKISFFISMFFIFPLAEIFGPSVGFFFLALWGMILAWGVFRRRKPLVRFEGEGGERQTADPMLARAKRAFAVLRSTRLRSLTRRLLARGLRLRKAIEASENLPSQRMREELDETMMRALEQAEAIGRLEQRVLDEDVSELHEQMQRLDEQAADADDIHELDDIAEAQDALRERLGEHDTYQEEIVRRTGLLLDATARLAKLNRQLDGLEALDTDDALSSVSAILEGLEFELQAHHELELELAGHPADS